MGSISISRLCGTFLDFNVSNSRAYTSFTGKDASMSGNVKFIIETEGFDDGSED